MATERSLAQMAADGDPHARRMVDTIGWVLSLVILTSLVALVALAVWAVVFTVNGGDWLAS